MTEARYKTQDVEQVPSGWRVRTVQSGAHQIRVAFPPGPRRRGAGKVVQILHPRTDNPCSLNPAELVILGNPSKDVPTQHQIRIAEETLKMSDVMARVMGGMTKDEARAILRKYRIRFKENPPPEATETQQAVSLYQEFHGRDPKAIVEAQRSAAMRLDYTCLGDLLGVAPFVEGLKIPAPTHWDDGGYPVLQFAGVKLASNAAGTQLYAIGGDQDLTEVLGDFPDADATKDLIDLGEIAYVTYEARKSMDGHQLVEYTHEFDEPRPRLGFDRVKREIFFAGGRYQVNAPGIEH